MDLARVILNIVLWAAILGFVIFCVLYAVLASPWRDHMGRHVLAFMSGLAVSLFYGGISRFISPDLRTIGWTISLALIAVLVWWRVVILLKYQMHARTHQ